MRRQLYDEERRTSTFCSMASLSLIAAILWVFLMITPHQADADIKSVGRVLGFKPELTLIIPPLAGFSLFVTKSLPRHDVLMNGSNSRAALAESDVREASDSRRVAAA